MVGRYVFSAAIWNLLKRTPAGAGDEIQLTDALAVLLKDQSMEAYRIVGRSHDCGSKLGYLEAIVTYALKDQVLGAEFGAYLQTLLSNKKLSLIA